MTLLFYPAALIAIIASLLAVTNYSPVHALLYFIVSLLAVAMVFFSLGAPFAGILEVIIYAGAIMVLFVFVVMLLNLGRATVEQERRWITPRTWLGPSILTSGLLWELGATIQHWVPTTARLGSSIGATQVGIAAFGPYMLGAELASMLLLAGLVVAFHLGRQL